MILITEEKTQDNKVTTRMRLYQIISKNKIVSIAEATNFKQSPIEVTNPDQQSQDPVNIQLFDSDGLNEYWLLAHQKERLLFSYDRRTLTVISKKFSDLIDINCPMCLNMSSINDLTLRTIGTNAFVDLNLDCRPDLVLESFGPSNQKHLEFYMYQNTGKFGLVKLLPLPKSMQNLSLGTFIDIDNNKAMDIVFWNKDINKL